MSSAPPPPQPSASPGAPPRVVRAPPRRPSPRAPGLPPWAERRPAVSVDLDRGRRSSRAEVDGVGTASLPTRHRLRVEGSRWQRDWKVSEVAARVLALPRADAHAVDAVLNCWAGRFARRNFPLLIREFAIAGSLKHAVHVFRWMKNQENYCARTDIYGMMIRLHARHNQVDQARGLFFEMQEWRCKPDADTFNSLIHAHARAGQWRWAINIMEDMQRAAVPPSRTTYNNVINACGAAGNWKKALELCKKMSENGVGPDLVTHNIVLSAFKNGAQYSKAIAYYEIMKGSNIIPDTFTLNIVIHCLVKVGQYGEAIELFNSMREKRTICPPDVVTYTSIMQSYSVCGQAENCKAVFDMMLAEGVKPNIVSYNALLGAYASHGMHKEALEIFKLLKQNGLRPDIVSYTSLLNAYGKSALPEKAREVFNEMRNNSCEPNIVSYNALIDAYGSAGMLKEAISLLHGMERDGIQPDVVSISTLLTACGRCRQLAKIDTILAAAHSRGIKLNVVAYNSGIGSYLSLGDYEKALQLYTLMRASSVKPDAVTYNILISGSCKLGKYADSLKFFEDMKDLKIHLTKEVYSSIICSYVKQGILIEAESTFNSMKESGCFPDVLTYTSMMKAYNDDGTWRKAWDLFKEMEGNDIQPDAIICSSLMEALNKGSQPERVLQLMELMKQKDIPLNQKAYFEIIASCSMLRDWKTASEIIEHLDSSLSSISFGTLNHLLNFLGKCGKTESMMKLFYKMVTSCSTVGLSTYEVLLRNLLVVGKWRKYVEVLQWMEDAGVHPTLYMYQSVLPYIWRDNSMDYVNLMQEKITPMTRRSYLPARPAPRNSRRRQQTLAGHADTSLPAAAVLRPPASRTSSARCLRTSLPPRHPAVACPPARRHLHAPCPAQANVLPCLRRLSPQPAAPLPSPIHKLSAASPCISPPRRHLYPCRHSPGTRRVVPPAICSSVPRLPTSPAVQPPGRVAALLCGLRPDLDRPAKVCPVQAAIQASVLLLFFVDVLFSSCQVFIITLFSSSRCNPRMF